MRSNGWKILCLLVPLSLVPFTGCNSSVLSYKPNDLHAASLTHESADSSPKAAASSVSQWLENWFGTIDAPIWPSPVADVPVVNMQAVVRCAGPVGRLEDKVERGIFRKHCVTCHGLSGDGRGPAAMFLDPYPRDFRRGTFKFKSTPAGSKPTADDLQHVLRHGIPGTSMPSFQALEESEEFANDVEDLSQYVQFLAIRGEVERRMLTKLLRDSEPLTPESQWPLDILRSVVEKWNDAPNQAFPTPSIPNWLTDPTQNKERSEAVAKGKELFGSELTACSKCHGPSGRGDGASQDYDEWTKDWTVLAGIDPKQPGAWKVMKPFGALKPVIAKPRNLQWGGLHGGSDPVSIYKRIVLGIEGTPMPPVARSSNSNPGLNEEEIWCLVGYVQELGQAQRIAESTPQNTQSAAANSLNTSDPKSMQKAEDKVQPSESSTLVMRGVKGE